MLILSLDHIPHLTITRFIHVLLKNILISLLAKISCFRQTIRVYALLYNYLLPLQHLFLLFIVELPALFTIEIIHQMYHVLDSLPILLIVLLAVGTISLSCLPNIF